MKSSTALLALSNLMMVAASASRASEYLMNWKPNNYRFKCSVFDCCYDESAHAMAEMLTPEVIEGMRQRNLMHPFGLESGLVLELQRTTSNYMKRTGIPSPVRHLAACR